MFAYIRFPGEKEIRCFVKSTHKTTKHLVIQPFDKALPPNQLSEVKQPESLDQTVHLIETNMNGLSKEAYIQYIQDTKDFIQKNGMEKLVVSRIHSMDKPIGFNPFLFFNTLCHAYPNTCNSLIYTDESIWIGASPELLIQKKGQTIQIMSLAGTIPLNTAEGFGQKEVLEQEYVTSYINNQLKDFCNPLSIRISERKELVAGPVKHILHTFEANLNHSADFEKLVNHLHPTPAVAGSPKELAIDFINKNEPNRNLYSGYLGVIDEEDAALYVNLRCTQVFQNKLLFYAGGGITIDSDPEKEWSETEWKMDTLKKLLV